ncbi:MAG TPA: alpha/beta hydrolase [Thermoanaerobaculia bacterium]|nr:alpha/beta hydrolase [Thermoanaerobaculia bacterium]
MDPLESLVCRMSFSGVPLGEIQRIVRRTEAGASWLRACLESAGGMRRLARRNESERRQGAACDAWRWTAAAYQAASFCAHFDPVPAAQRQMQRARRLARAAYLRAIALDEDVAEPVSVPFGDHPIHGYFRRPRRRGLAPVVVLLNGLDSVCEVEMHAFGAWLLSRGFAVLALDLPADAASASRAPLLQVERAAAAIASFTDDLDGVRPGARGAFGVSFGGHLAARLLTVPGAFRCGVAVSPPAWIGRGELPPRVETMLAWAFDATTGEDLDAVTAHANLRMLPKPHGRLLLFHMDRDRLFDEQHARAFVAWGGDAVTVRHVDAEHVGTSSYHQWLPFACDWLRSELEDGLS